MEYEGIKAKEYYDIFVEDYNRFNMAYDNFIKTTKEKQNEDY